MSGPSYPEGLPEDVVDRLEDSTKSFNLSRLRRLLRDTYYAGPIPVGKGPKRSTGKSRGSPGSGLRRASEGALYEATKQMRQAILDRALETGLIRHWDEWGYTTTPKGASVLSEIDQCDECGQQREGRVQEKTIQISRYNTATNYNLVTVCPDGHEKDEYRGTLHDESRSYTGASRDAALTFISNRTEDELEQIEIHGVSEADLDGWKTPAERAVELFHEKMDRDDAHNSFGYSTAIYTVLDEFDEAYHRNFADLLRDEYEWDSLKYAQLTYLSEGAWEPPEDFENSEGHPLPNTLPGETIRATFIMPLVGREVTLGFQGKSRTYDKDDLPTLQLTTTGYAGNGEAVVKMGKTAPGGHRSVVGPVANMEILFKHDNPTAVDEDTVESITQSAKPSIGKSHINARTVKTKLYENNSTPAEAIEVAQRLVEYADDSTAEYRIDDWVEWAAQQDVEDRPPEVSYRNPMIDAMEA